MILASVLFASAVLVGCQQQAPKKQMPMVGVAAIKITPQAMPIYRDYIGITQSVSSIGIRARVQGFLIKKNFIEGDAVKKDQLLFEIDPAPFQADQEQATGQLAEAIAESEFQKVNYERMKDLFAKAVISKETFDKVSTQYKQSLAKVLTAKAQLENAKINLGYCYMYSPVEGRISQIQVDVGNLVGGAQNTLLATVVKLDPMYVEFSPSVSDFSEILKYWKNMPFKVAVSLPKNSKMTFNGKVDLINNQANTDTSTVLMRAVIENPQKLLIPGIYVNLKMILGTNPKAIVLPASLVMDNQGSQFVYVIGSNNVVKAQTVTTENSGKGQVIVDSGLNPGDLVISTNLAKIQAGQTVNYTLQNNSQ